MKSKIKSLALLLTILSLISFGLLTTPQAQNKIQFPGTIIHRESIRDLGGGSTYKSTLEINQDILYKINTDVSMEVLVEVFDVTEGSYTTVLSDGLISENGVLKGTFFVNLQPEHTYELWETYTGGAVPKAIIPLPTYDLSLDTFKHKFTVAAGFDSAMFEIRIDVGVNNLDVEIPAQDQLGNPYDLEGWMDKEETEKLALKDGFTIPEDGLLPDKVVVLLTPTRDIFVGDVIKYHSGFSATFSGTTTVGPKGYVGSPWDINRDSVVDISDLVFVGKDFGKQEPGLSADVNKDDVIDIVDLMLVGKHFGEEY